MAAQPESQPLPQAGFRPVRSHHAFEACVEQLATAIRLGVYPKGTALPPERDLAEQLGVSRATLREAIAALRSAGLVETTRGRGGGTVVKKLPAAKKARTKASIARRNAELLDSLVFRSIVEPGAAALAAGRDLDPEMREQLRAYAAEAADAEGTLAYRQHDSRLHLAIAAASGSDLTMEAVTKVQADLDELLQGIPVLRVNIGHSTSQHNGVVKAILAGNARRAAKVMTEHCEDTAALLRGLLVG